MCSDQWLTIMRFECSIPGLSTETNANNLGNSNFNNRPDNTHYQTIIKSDIFFPGSKQRE